MSSFKMIQKGSNWTTNHGYGDSNVETIFWFLINNHQWCGHDEEEVVEQSGNRRRRPQPDSALLSHFWSSDRFWDPTASDREVGRKQTADFDTLAVINRQTLKAPRDVCLLYVKTTLNQSTSFQQQVSFRLNSSSLPGQLKPGVNPVSMSARARVRVSAGHTELD